MNVYRWLGAQGRHHGWYTRGNPVAKVRGSLFFRQGSYREYGYAAKPGRPTDVIRHYSNTTTTLQPPHISSYKVYPSSLALYIFWHCLPNSIAKSTELRRFLGMRNYH
ncbi:MAG: hypothetical protein ABSA33_05190 [Candidatus Micrarchaeaceae archaeon]